MDYQITLDPALGITAQEFVNTWNGVMACETVAKAHLEPAPPSQPTPLALPAIAVLNNVAAGLTTDALYDLIRHALEQKRITTPVEMELHEQTDNPCLISIAPAEEG